jgi:hypothetical protein
MTRNCTIYLLKAGADLSRIYSGIHTYLFIYKYIYTHAHSRVQTWCIRIKTNLYWTKFQNTKQLSLTRPQNGKRQISIAVKKVMRWIKKEEGL